MTEKEKITLLEEIMELNEGTLSVDDVLEDYVEWDSITALSLIAMMDEKFGKTISGADVKGLRTVADAINMMTK